MPVNMLVWQAGCMENDVGESSARKVRPHGSAKFRERIAQQPQRSSDTVRLHSQSRSGSCAQRRRSHTRRFVRSCLAFLHCGGWPAVQPILAVRGRPAEDEYASVLQRHLLHQAGRRLRTAPAVHTVDARAVPGEVAERRRAEEELACRASEEAGGQRMLTE